MIDQKEIEALKLEFGISSKEENSMSLRDSDYLESRTVIGGNTDKSVENKVSNEENKNSENNQDNIVKEVVPVTDRELLAIANLSNLRLEFANLIINADDEDKSSNHTLRTLLRTECKGIDARNEGNKEAKGVFYNLETDDNLTVMKTPLYTSRTELKTTSGIAYEYFEKGETAKTDEEKAETEFLDQWEPIYAADGWKLVTEFIDFLYNDKSRKYSIKSSMYNFLYVLHNGDSKKIGEDIEKINIFVSKPQNNQKFLKDSDILDKILSFELDLAANKFEIKDQVYGNLIIIPEKVKDNIHSFFTKKIKNLKIEERGLYDSRKITISKIKAKEELIKKGLKANIGVTIFFGAVGGWTGASPSFIDDLIEESTEQLGKIATNEKATIDAAKNVAISEANEKITIKNVSEEMIYAGNTYTSEGVAIFLDGKKVTRVTAISENTIEIGETLLKSDNIFIDDLALNFQEQKFLEDLIKLKEKQTTLAISKVTTKFPLLIKNNTFIKTSINTKINHLKQNEVKFLVKDGINTKSMVDDYLFKLSSSIAEHMMSLPTEIENITKSVLKSELSTEVSEGSNGPQKSDKEIQMEALYHKNMVFSDITSKIMSEYCFQLREFLEEENKELPADVDIFENENIAGVVKEIENAKVFDEISSALQEYPTQYFDYKVSIFINKSKHQLILCFNTESKFSFMKKDLEEKKYRSIFLLMNILRNFTLEKLFIEYDDLDLRNYSLKVTGIDMGAELANIFHLAVKEADTTIFKTKDISFHGALRTFNTATIASLFNMKYSTTNDILNEVIRTMKGTMGFETKWGIGVGQSLGIIVRFVAKMVATKTGLFTVAIGSGKAILVGVGVSTFISVLAVPFLILIVSFIANSIENNRNNKYYMYFYVQLCRMGIILCSRCESQKKEKTLENCIFCKENNGLGKEPPLASVDDIKKILNDNFRIFKEVSQKIPANVYVTGDMFLDIITEFYYFSNDINEFPKLFEKVREKGLVSENSVIELLDHNKGIYNIKGIFSKGNDHMKNRKDEFLRGLNILEQLDPPLYNKVKTTVPTCAKYEIQKYTHLYLEPQQVKEKTQSAKSFYKLRKKYFYTCDISQNIISSESILGTEQKDTSLGANKVLFLEMINLISDIQHIQDEVDFIKKRYKVYAFGIPSRETETGEERCKKNLNTPIIYAKKNSFLTATEREFLGVERKVLNDGTLGTVVNSKDYIEKWNKKRNSRHYEEKIPVLSNEFIFFPLINSKTGMIADDELFCDCDVRPDPEANGDLSKYFSEKETTVSSKGESLGLKNIPNAAIKENIKYAAQRLDIFREFLGVPFHIHSWFRSFDVNNAVGGVPGSDHLLGLAIDFSSPKMAAKKIYEKIQASNMPYKQLIYYPKSGFIHIAFMLNREEEKKRKNQFVHI